MKKPPVISIIGPDGAGKSTQTRKLVDAFESNNIDCEYRWFGAKHLVSLPLLAYARIAGLSEVKQLESGRKIGYHYFWQSNVVSALYPVLLLVDTFLFYVFQIYIPTVVFGRTLVCDRFVYDIVVSVMLSIDDDEFYRTFIGDLFLRLIPDRACIILLTADAEYLRPRRDDVRSDDTLPQMVELYDELAEVNGIRKIDATKSKEQIHQEIIDQLT
ncbi:hypothetical protein [Haloarcula sp. JP-L23]|uniref:hypothetical protein n=1 Tax=Haloarcula sp. JP-L23 TaxID=2716717 RepID=UPI00140EAFAF|nr:hypothetical protein G9465_17885 [Haloarcula sp. JP-L23]